MNAPNFEIGSAKPVWIDENGREHTWEFVTRKSRPREVANAVYILALVQLPDGSLAVPIVIQYRPPVNALVIEFPAGLVEQGESEAGCALRELYEETGLGRKGKVEITEISGALCCDAGLSASTIKRVEVLIQLDHEDDLPPTDRFIQNEEHIVSGLITLTNFAETIQELADKPGYLIGSGVQSYADGLRHHASTVDI